MTGVDALALFLNQTFLCSVETLDEAFYRTGTSHDGFESTGRIVLGHWDSISHRFCESIPGKTLNTAALKRRLIIQSPAVRTSLGRSADCVS